MTVSAIASSSLHSRCDLGKVCAKMYRSHACIKGKTGYAPGDIRTNFGHAPGAGAVGLGNRAHAADIAAGGAVANANGWTKTTKGPVPLCMKGRDMERRSGSKTDRVHSIRLMMLKQLSRRIL